MSNGFYTAASSMLTAQRKLSVLSNNISNIETPGFRTQYVVTTSFEQELLVRMEKGNSGAVGSGSPIQVVEDVSTDFDPSAINQTNRPFDFALGAEGYFNIRVTPKNNNQEDMEADFMEQDNQGEVFLTRNGSFNLDKDSFLVLEGVGRVQGENGDIELKTSNFTVDPEGYVYENGKKIDRILVTMPTEDEKLVKYGGGLFRVANPDNNLQVENTRVMQNSLEFSNIDPNKEMTKIMEAQRAFQAASSALQIIDRMNQRTATDIASI